MTDNQPRYTTARLRREVDEAKRLARIHALEEAANIADAAADKTPWEQRKKVARRIADAIRLVMKEEKY